MSILTMPQHWQAYPSRKRILRLVAIHASPRMRGVAPAFVCSVGNRVVAMAVSLLGSPCRFMGSPINPPSRYASALVVAVRTSTDSGCAAAGDAAPLAPGAPVPHPGEWGGDYWQASHVPSSLRSQMTGKGVSSFRSSAKGSGLSCSGVVSGFMLFGCGRTTNRTKPDIGRVVAR